LGRAAFQAKGNSSVALHKADNYTDGKTALHEGLSCVACKYWTHWCQGPTPCSQLHHGGWLLTCLWRKHHSSSFYRINRTQLNRTMLRPLKGRRGPITRTIKPFYELFYWVIWRKECAASTVCPEISLAVSSPADPAGKFFSEGLSTTV